MLIIDFLQFFYVSKEVVQEWRTTLEERYKRASRIPAIQMCHCFLVEGYNNLKTKRYSLAADFTLLHPIHDDSSDDNDPQVAETGRKIKPNS